MSSLVIINGVVYDIVSTSETSVCEKCAFIENDEKDVFCPRLNVVDIVPFPLVCSWLDDNDDGFHYFIKREM